MAPLRDDAAELPRLASSVRGVLNSSTDAMIVLVGAWRYRSSVRFDFEMTKRDGVGLVESHGFGRPPHDVEDVLLAFEWSDGSVSSNLPGRGRDGGLSSVGGSSGPHRGRMGLVLDHLPPPGEFRIHSRWRRRGLVTRASDFSADELRRAATGIAVEDSSVDGDEPDWFEAYASQLPESAASQSRCRPWIPDPE